MDAAESFWGRIRKLVWDSNAGTLTDDFLLNVLSDAGVAITAVVIVALIFDHWRKRPWKKLRLQITGDVAMHAEKFIGAALEFYNAILWYVELPDEIRQRDVKSAFERVRIEESKHEDIVADCMNVYGVIVTPEMLEAMQTVRAFLESEYHCKFRRRVWQLGQLVAALEIAENGSHDGEKEFRRQSLIAFRYKWVPVVPERIARVRKVLSSAKNSALPFAYLRKLLWPFGRLLLFPLRKWIERVEARTNAEWRGSILAGTAPPGSGPAIWKRVPPKEEQMKAIAIYLRKRYNIDWQEDEFFSSLPWKTFPVENWFGAGGMWR